MAHVIKWSNVEMELVHDEEVEMDVEYDVVGAMELAGEDSVHGGVGEQVVADGVDQGVKGHNEDSEILLEFRYSLMIHMNQGMGES